MMAIGPILLLSLLLNGDSTELLDYMPTQAYWQAQGVDPITWEALSPYVVEDAPVGGAGERVAGEIPLPGKSRVQRLMAIRAAGELELAEAKPRLAELVESDQPFVADYARRALALLGEPVEAVGERARVAAQILASDLALLSDGSELVAQADLTRGVRDAVDLDQAIGQAVAMFPPDSGIERDAVEAMLVQMVSQAAHIIGNVRVDAITLGVQGNPDGDGHMVAVVRGSYDPEVVRAALVLADMTTQEALGRTVYQPDGDARFVLDDARLVFMAAENETSLPVDAVVAALATPGEQPAPKFGGAMTRAVTSVDREAEVWFAATGGDLLRSAEPFAPFDQIVGRFRQAGERVQIEARGVGHDAAAVEAVVQTMRSEMAESLEHAKRAMAGGPAPMAKMMEPTIAFLESVEFTTDGAEATMTASIERRTVMQLLATTLGMWFQASPAVAVEAQDAKATPQEAEPAQPVPEF